MHTQGGLCMQTIEPSEMRIPLASDFALISTILDMRMANLLACEAPLTSFASRRDVPKEGLWVRLHGA